MRCTPLLAASLVLGALSACAGPTEFYRDGSLSIQAGAATLRLTNLTDAPVYTFVLERSSAAVVDWIPCTDPVKCSGIAPGEQRAVPYTEIAGYEQGEQEAIVYWWHLQPRLEGGFRTDSIRSEVVRL